MSFGNVVEAVHVVAQFKEEICAEGHEYPEWKLEVGQVSELKEVFDDARIAREGKRKRTTGTISF